MARLQRYSNLGPLTRLSFDNLIARGRSADPRDQERFRRCVEDARSFAESPDGWLVLTGASGCGKTHVAAAVANRCLALGRPALFVVVPDLLDHLRAAYSPDAELGYDRLFEQVRNAPVLVLDDLGTQSATPWAQEKLFQLINHRYNARLPTVVTTNLPLSTLDDRLRTRLTDPSLARVYRLEEHRGSDAGAPDPLDLPRLRTMTFETFDTRRYDLPAEERRLLEVAYRAALRFAEQPDGWLAFIGPHGSGKTHLAAAIANDRRRRGERPTFAVVHELLDELRRAFSPEGGGWQRFDDLKSAPLLILDDLDAQAAIAWVGEKLFHLLDHRHRARLATVITTVLTLDELGERLASRLLDPSVCAVMPLGPRVAPPDAPAARPAPRGRGRRRA